MWKAQRASCPASAEDWTGSPCGCPGLQVKKYNLISGCACDLGRAGPTAIVNLGGGGLLIPAWGSDKSFQAKVLTQVPGVRI